MSNVSYNRLLRMNLPARQSAFLWGARKTGKSTYLRKNFPHSVFYDLLKTDLYFRLSKQPSILREEVLALDDEKLMHPIIIYEVQLIPALMNEIHWLIENTKANFILCGSSARQMKAKGVNLLGGRAWSYHFYPLVYQEIDDFDLLKLFEYGSIPSHYTSPDINRSLKAYINDYLTQEIKNEGLVRNLPAFARFLDCVGFTNTQMVNFSNIARDCAIDAKTVKEYFQILADTLLGYYIYPFNKRVKRDIITHMPKFYLFDIGVANKLGKRTVTDIRNEVAGQLFEHFILLELIAYKGINGLDFDITYWKTKTGIEVDFVLGDAKVAIEVKISDRQRTENLTGLVAFAKEHLTTKPILVSTNNISRKIVKDGVTIDMMNYKEFITKLWQGEIVASS